MHHALAEWSGIGAESERDCRSRMERDHRSRMERDRRSRMERDRSGIGAESERDRSGIGAGSERDRGIGPVVIYFHNNAHRRRSTRKALAVRTLSTPALKSVERLERFWQNKKLFKRMTDREP
ncbi:MAG TPA: hypothetical protein VLS45_04280, partial [Methylomicrobium sp.]|nr:hypothetical protein [Methylomicrobium sp.]